MDHNIFNLKAAKSPSRLRFEAYLSSEKSQLYRVVKISHFNTWRTVFVRKA